MIIDIKRLNESVAASVEIKGMSPYSDTVATKLSCSVEVAASRETLI